ncbi:alpha-2-macroglobulin-like protein 1 [Pelodytes ibericus]
MMKGLLLGFLLVDLIAGQTIDMNFLVTLPAVLKYPSNETACIHLRSPNIDTELSISLITQAAKILLASKKYTGVGTMECLTFKVPPPTGVEYEVATVEVTVQSGGVSQVLESKKVMIKPTEPGVFINPDKPIYRPGEKVNIRIACFDHNLVPIDKELPLIDITDPKVNRIWQWKGVRCKSGIADLSYVLSQELILGNYDIAVKDDGGKPVKTTAFSVEKFVPPKFEFTVQSPGSLTITQGTLNIKMCGKYTYQKPVRGEVSGKMCRSASPNSDKTDICKPINGQTDPLGCYTEQMDTAFLELNSRGYSNYLDLTASLVEEGTGVELQEKKTIFISTIITTVDFSDAASTYRPGLLYRGKMRLTGADGSPIPNEDLLLYVNEARQDDTYTTDEDGFASFSLDTSSWTGDHINLRGEYRPLQDVTNTGEVQPIHNQGYTFVTRFYSAVKSHLKIRNDPSSGSCDKSMQLWADFIIEPSEIEGKDSLTFFFLVIGRNGVIQNSEIKHALSPNRGFKGFVSVPLTFTAKMAPEFTLLLYIVLPTGGLVADSSVFKISNNCFANKVSLTFSEKQSLPGAEVNLHIGAEPGSLCATRAIDKSIRLLRPDAKIPVDEVNYFLLLKTQRGYPPAVEEFQLCPIPFPKPFPPPRPIPILLNNEERLLRSQPVVPLEQLTDVYSLFKNAGQKVLTNWIIRRKLECNVNFSTLELKPTFALSETIAFSSNDIIVHSDILQSPTPPAIIRKDFPDTWIWSLIPVGPSGQADTLVTLPDTITQWVADTFCMNPIGMGFSLMANITVFQPFFVELSLPYSVKKGESFRLTATVFNHMRQCIKVRVTLFQSGDFVLEPCDGCSYIVCLCSNPTFTATWIITPKKLGDIELLVTTEALDTKDLCDGQRPVVPQKGKSDTVLKRLKVEPEGTRVENTHSSLLCAFDSEEIPLQIPKDAVEGSESATVIVTGDVMSSSYTNMGDLLQKPYGCGEQNMIHFAINIAIMLYMGTTGQITDEIRDKIDKFNKDGFQRQLLYKRKDGSYSAFGDQDKSGNTWLTGFVAVTFIGAGSNMDIYDKHILDALDWLQGLQKEDGCFSNIGKLFHNDLQGGLDGEVALTCYLVVTFQKYTLQKKEDKYEPVIQKAMACMKKSLAPESSTYSKALCAYAYTLHKDLEERATLLKQLDGKAKTQGKLKFWSETSQVLDDKIIWSNPQPAAVETTAYVLLATVSKEQTTSTDLAAALPLVQYLTSQQNSRGGFSTTADTVVGLQALAQYAMWTYTPHSSPIITITNTNGFSHTFLVNADNRLIMQQKDLPDIPGVYKVSASGSGCAYVKIISRYNIPLPKTTGTFSLEVKTTSIRCPPHPLPKFNVTIKASYIGSRSVSNMALLQVSLLSGYVAVEDSVNKLLAHDLIKRTEVTKSSINIYFEELTRTPVTISFQLEQECLVRNIKPGLIKLYDYYKPTSQNPQCDPELERNLANVADFRSGDPATELWKSGDLNGSLGHLDFYGEGVSLFRGPFWEELGFYRNNQVPQYPKSSQYGPEGPK